MKSLVVRHSVVIRGHKTSVSLEDRFWNALQDIAKERYQSVGQLIESIDTKRRHVNLSSALRMFVLSFYQHEFEIAKRVRAEFLNRSLTIF